MLIVWSGWGILVIPVVVIGYFVGALLVTGLVRLGLAEHARLLMLMAAGFFPGISAVGACYALERFLDAHNIGRVMIDKTSGVEFRLRRKDALFFIPIKWWTRIIAAIFVVGFIISVVVTIYGMFFRHS